MTTAAEMTIRPLIRQDLPALIAHCIRVTEESGQGGNPIFSPYDSKSPWNKSEAEKSIAKAWATPTSQPGWRRDWGVFRGEKIVGNLDLRGGALHSGLHRATLGIGVELEAQGQSLGKGLMVQAIAWAKTQPELSWIDLYVFANNGRALKMYEALGFRSVGRHIDRFRINGVSVDDIAMVLALKD